MLTDSLRITAEFLPAPSNLPPVVLGWTPLAHASRFAMVEGAFTWDEARIEAVAMGGHLATFSTEAEWTATTPMRQSARSPHWIGGQQTNAPESPLSDWKWITDEPWLFSAWSPAEPNDYQGASEDRLEVFEYGAWNDADASNARGFMVEFASGDSSPLVSSVSVTEGEALALALKAADPDGASSALNTLLLSGPEGLFLNSSGTLIWQPAEGQGPATHLVSFVVTDGGTPPASSTNTLQILVTESNNPPQFRGDLRLTFGAFSAADGMLISSNASPLASTGGNPGGFLPLTFATTNQYSVLVTSPDQSPLGPVVGFHLSCDVRSGNGTYERNADGMSFSFPRVGDPVLLNPQDQSGFAGGCCAETGTGTGLTISFDTWSGNLFPHSPGDTNDVEGILVRVDNETVAKIPLPIRNGSPDDPSSLQTGPRDPGYWNAGRSPWSHEAWESLSWRPLVIELTPDGRLSIGWKSVLLLDGFQIATPPLDGRLVIAGRAEWANANLHLDNLRLETVRHHQSVEGSPVAIALGASDPDRPAQQLQYRLLEAPPGATITDTGILQWNPNESVGGSTNVIVVRVDDSGVPPMSATNRIRLVVIEDNQPPVVTSSEVAETMEGSALQAAVTAVDADIPAQTLSFSLIAGPPELTLGADGRLNWTPSEDQGPSTNAVIVRICDNGVPSLCITNELRIRVREVNQPPVFTSLPPFSMTEGESLTGNLVANDRDWPLQDLTYSLLSGPTGFLVRADGGFSWTTGEEHGPVSHEITVSVTDNGVPPLSATNTFQVSVAEENTRPVLEPLPDLVAVEHALLRLPLAGQDSDLPPQSLMYRLEGAPEGMILHPSGLVEWSPSEVQGESTNRVVISLSDNGSPSLSATIEFLIVVLETNAPPTLAIPEEVRLEEQQPFTFLLEARDIDDPAQVLSYALVEGPEGLSISQTGLIQWKPSEAQGPSTNVLTVRISDDGTPPQTVTAATRLIVNEINGTPEILGHADQATSEGDLYRTVMEAVDADIPAQSLSFALVSGPEGVSVTPDGVVEWRPREDQGPSTNVIAVSVSDDGLPPLAATNEIVVLVLEVNLPPRIPEIPELSIIQGIPWRYAIQGEDPDLPPQRLSFRLMNGPAGLAVSDNGDMNWTPERWQSPSRNAVVVEISDDGVPLLSRQFAFTVDVRVPEEVPEILITAGNNTGDLHLEIRAMDGQRLVLENAAQVGAWQEVQHLTGLGKVSPIRVNIVAREDTSRYWRVLVGTQ
ncbi:MAG: hypothetical protein J0L84_12630 [Verrucomicrobia bacterium]|nr:hypothetical protein [Verrucomicrobiota bacterium]